MTPRASAAHAPVGRPAELAAVASRAAAAVTGDAAAVNPVAEEGEHGGQHRQRTDDGESDDQDRAQTDGEEVTGTGEQQASQSCDHGESSDEDRAAHGGCGGLECRVGRGLASLPRRPVAPASFLSFTAHIEQ